jgi:putative tricarboxylic transport membrane protein
MLSERLQIVFGESCRRVFASRNVVAGLMFMAIALAGLWISRNYPVGTAVRMGTGYMPRLLLWLLFLLGGAVLLVGLRESNKPRQSVSSWERLRPIVFITASIVIFALCIERLGLVISTLLLIFVGGMAHRELRLVEILLTSVVLVVLSLAVFIVGLDLTIPVWPDW